MVSEFTTVNFTYCFKCETIEKSIDLILLFESVKKIKQRSGSKNQIVILTSDLFIVFHGTRESAFFAVRRWLIQLIGRH
jgi:hypothetical protein